MNRRQTPWLLVALGLGVGLLVVFLWDDVIAPSLGIGASAETMSEGERYELEHEARLADLREQATLRGIPGMHGEITGEGVVRGRVLLHVPEGPLRPLEGVRVESTVVDAKGKLITRDTVTDAQGRFEWEAVKAGFGYLLSIRHRPYKEQLIRGITVRANRVTVIDDIVLGAPTTLRGEVRTAHGGPPPGARVQVLSDTSRPDSFDLRQSLFEMQAALEFRAEAEVDRDGAFQIKDLPPGRYVLRVSAPGYATAFRAGVIVTLDEHSAEPRITLDKGAGYEGRIQDADGQGLAGARILAVAAPGAGTTRIDRVDATADASGRYRLDRLIPGVRYFIEAWADGFAPAGTFLKVGEGVSERDVTLHPAGTITGRITDAKTGGGIAQVEVTVAAGSFAQMSPVSTVTDADGRYTLPHVSPGNVLLFSALSPGYQQVSELALGGVKREGAALSVKAGETTVLDWALEPGGTLEGTVRTTAGAAVTFATVAVVDRRRRMEGETTALTDESGRYQIHGLRATEYDVRITAPGHAPLTDDEGARVTIPDRLGVHIHDIVLEVGATLEGVVKSPDGLPVGGATVSVKATGGSRRVRERVRDLVAISDAAGAFRLDGVPPSVPLVAIAEHDGFVRVQSGSLRLTPGQTRKLELALRPGASLPGRVTSARGGPIAGARVRWGNVDDVEPRRLRDAFGADEHLGPRVLYTDADGRFEVPNLEPGKTLVKVSKEGFGDWYRSDLQVGAEGVQPALTVELVGSLALSGRVVSDASGAPIKDALVYCREAGGGDAGPGDPGKVRALATAYTNVRGQFELTGLPPGRYDVVVWFATGYQSGASGRTDENRKRDIEAGSKGVEFRLIPPPD